MNKSDLRRDYWMLNGSFRNQGYDWWWHNFTAVNEKTGEEKSFFIEYFTCNPGQMNQIGGAIVPGEPICGQLMANKSTGVRPSYLMIKAGWWGKDKAQLNRFIAWRDTHIQSSSEGFTVSALNCYASETELFGTISVTPEEVKKHPEWMSDAGTIQWNLQLSKQISFNVGYGASSLFRKLKAFEMYWHAEGMKTQYSGTIFANGEEYKVYPEQSYGYADKNWGKNFTSPWVWLSSNDLVSKISERRLENSVFDIGGGCPKVFGIPLKRKLLSDFWYETRSLEFNFSKFWTFCRTKFDCQETNDKLVWNIYQETTKYAMEAKISCEKNEMLLINYESPDGQKRHNRLWNGGTGQGTVKIWKKMGRKKILLDEIEAKHVGCEYGEYGEYGK